MSDQELETTENPCWQDVYGDGDDDCGMSTVYSSSFVAEKWIKSMPCGHDLDVSVHVSIVWARSKSGHLRMTNDRHHGVSLRLFDHGSLCPPVDTRCGE